MAMTLRPRQEDEQVLAPLAEEQGISRQEVIIHEMAPRRGHEHRVTDALRRARARYADVLDRLGQ